MFLKSFNKRFEEVPLRDDFTINIDDYIGCGGNIIIIANPNVPTGLTISIDDIELILETNRKKIVIIDEAYVDFGTESCINLLEKYDNLILVCTFSKSRFLAGARLGFAISSKEIISDLNKIKFSINPYNINTLSMVTGLEALKEVDYFKVLNNKIILTRERMKEEVKSLGFNVTDSEANFLFLSHSKLTGEEYYKKLLEKRILIRYYNTTRIRNYVRITIGTDEQMNKVIRVTKEILNNLK